MYKDIELTSVKIFLETEFPNYSLPNIKLFKGISSSSQISDFLISSTKQIKRPSKTLAKNGNSYNLLLNNLSNWSDLPLREESIILTNNLETAKSFAFDNPSVENLNGKVFLVIPKKNAKLVVCPNNDIWYSFTKGLTCIGLRGLEANMINFNKILAEIAASVGINDFDQDWQNFKDLILNIQKKNLVINKQLNFKSKLVFDWIIKQPIDITIKFEEIFDPILNGFEVINFNKSCKSFDDNCNNEIWTDSDTLLIEVSKVKGII